MKRTATRIFLFLLAGLYVALFVTFNVRSKNFIIEYRINEQEPIQFPYKIEFNSKEHDTMLFGGFYYPESWGRWSRASPGMLGFKLSEPLPERIHCELKIPIVFVNSYNPKVQLAVDLNGSEVATFHFNKGEALLPSYPFTLGGSMLSANNTLTFNIDGFGKPSSNPNGKSGDNRELGIGLESLSFSLEPIPVNQE